MTVADQRCLSDGTYCALDRDLFRCLGSREPRSPAEARRVGFENAADPDDVRWVRPHSLFVQRLSFVYQGEPSTDREIVEAMR